MKRNAFRLDLVIEQGKTFAQVIRWMRPGKTYVPIQQILNDAPIKIVAAGHGLVNGWPARIDCAQGLDGLNQELFYPVAVVDQDALQFPGVNGRCLTPYVTGGTIEYYPSMDLASFTYRMEARESIESPAPLFSLASGSGIVVDPALRTLTVQLTAAQTAAFAWSRGVYDLEAESRGFVSLLGYGKVRVNPEVTRT